MGYVDYSSSGDGGEAPNLIHPQPPTVFVKGTSSPPQTSNKNEEPAKAVLPDSDGEEEVLPSSESLVTVDDFLSRQCALLAPAGKRKKRQTKYTRRTRKKTTDLGTSTTPDADLYDIIPPSFESSRRTQRLRNSNKKSQKSFSERMKSAAILSHVDMAMPLMPDMTEDTDPMINQLVTRPFDFNTPSSPSPRKRIKFIDVHTPRRIDDGFSDKENDGLIIMKKPVKPLSHWNPQTSTLANALIDSPDLSMNHILHVHSNQCTRTQNSRRAADSTPLKLVSYKEHSASLSAKFVS